MGNFSEQNWGDSAERHQMPGVIEIPERVLRSVITDELILIAGASEPAGVTEPG